MTPIVFGGKQRMVKFNHAALILLERHDLGEQKIAKAFQEQPLYVLRTMLWAGLGATETEEQIGEWMDECEDLRAVNVAVWEAFAESLQKVLKSLGVETNGGPPGAETTGPKLSASPMVPVTSRRKVSGA